MGSFEGTESNAAKKFSQLLIIEIAGAPAGAFAAKLFADYGANVIKVEPPGGDPSRLGNPDWHGMSPEFAYLNTSKRSASIDLETPDGLEALQQLLGRADVVIESSSPHPLRPVSLAWQDNPGLIKVYVSPFGLTGPYAAYSSTAFTDYAAGGHMFLNGEPGREPLQGAGQQASYAAGTHAFIGAMAALLSRERSGRGQVIDISHMETMASLHQWTTVRYSHGGYVQRRVGNRYDTTHPITVYPCKDGYVAVAASSQDQAERFLAVAGLSHLLEDERFATGVSRLANWEAFDAEVLPWLMAHTAEEIVRISQEVRVPVGLVPSMLELLEDKHLATRNFWTQVEPGGIRFPGPPFRSSTHPWSISRPPGAGQDTADARSESPKVENTGEVSPDGSERQLPLAGVRVLDLSRIWAGPLATRILGDLGADVIRVEAPWARGREVPDAVVQASRRYPNNEAGARPWNREGMFNKFNRNKRAVTLRLDTPEGREVFERLVAISDIVIENYSPRVMPQLGLGYEHLAQISPAIIYIGMPGFGWTGPARDYVALGTTIEPAAGLSSTMGYRDGGPYKSGVAWADPVAAMLAASALLMALYDRSADPAAHGQAIELSQHEGMITYIGEELLAAQLRGGDPPRLGNRHPKFAPQGCYPCHGDDRWIAISVVTDGEWRDLCELAGLPSEMADLSNQQRQANHDAIDELLAHWTSGQDHIELTRLLQSRGIAAFAALDAKELLEDPHLASREFFAKITHPDAGTFPFPGLPIHLSETPATYRLPAPGVGEHNVDVFVGLLGMTPSEMDALRAAGVVTDRPV